MEIKVPASLESAYEHCETITRLHGKNFHWGFRFLPPPERRALYALYAFARRTDDIVDDEGTADRAGAIAQWRRSTERALAGQAGEDPILDALADAAVRFSMPIDEISLLIEGCEDDLTIARYDTLEATLGYCRKVAVTVGMLMLAIFNSRSEEARRAMASIGYAFQLTNILRDIPEDLRRDRIYLPRELMARHAVTESELRSNSGTRSLMEEMTRITRAKYREADPLFRILESGPARTMRVMGRIYEAILDRIEAQDFDVWSRRPSVSKLKKIGIILSASLRR